MNLENIKSIIEPNAKVSDGVLYIDGYVTDKPEIVGPFEEIDPSQANQLLEKLLELGAETFRIMGTSATNEILQNVANNVKDEINSKRLEIVSDIESMAKQLVSESGDLSVRNVLQSWRTEFSSLLENSFDPQRADSIMKKFDTAMNQWAKNQQDRVIEELNLNRNGSSLYGLNDSITKHITDTVNTVQDQIKNIEIALNVNEANKKLKKKVASRGTDFEEVVFSFVDEISHEYRDIADNPGKSKTPGISGNDEGDITVDLNTAQTHGERVTFAWECKLRSAKKSDRWLFDELSRGMANRGAAAGVIATDAVTSGSEGDNDFFREEGNMAILILDALDPEPTHIRFAYLWSRWMAARGASALLNAGNVSDIVESIKRELATIKTIKGHHSKMKTELELVVPKVESLETNVLLELSKLQEMLDSLSDQEE